MELLKAHQLDIMLFMCGVCGILAVMTAVTKALPHRTKRILALMEISAMLLLFLDRLCYLYRGDESVLGFYMVRICNGLVYLFLLIIPVLVSKFLSDVLVNDCGLQKPPVQIRISEFLFVAGVVLLIVSQFTGLYYTFDSHNNYQRSFWNPLCYVAPVLIVILQEWTIIRYRKLIKKSLFISMMICISLPTLASVAQIFAYGLSLTNLTTAFTVVVFYTYTLNYLSEASERARKHELEYYKEAKRKETALFEQTIEALANAIDAKDKYTHGHSARVAAYSKRIAQNAGLPEVTCEEVYFAALLHDVGKIGVSNDILNKVGPLTEPELKQIKNHPVLGSQILSSIKQAPFLKTGAQYHHERYDGHGYPEGLAGENIPEIARLISVADAYDAMTSLRSYRKPLSPEEVKTEFINGRGTQFDPVFTDVMLHIIEIGEAKDGTTCDGPGETAQKD
ncbi:MAG: HD domain-containing protein [Clostridia bacterium]|nr:HD domain-containing protein [Clostridia bacterium]